MSHRCPYCHCDLTDHDSRIIRQAQEAAEEFDRTHQADEAAEAIEQISRAEGRGLELWQLLDEEEEREADYQDDDGCDWHCTDDEDVDSGILGELGMSEFRRP